MLQLARRQLENNEVCLKTISHQRTDNQSENWPPADYNFAERKHGHEEKTGSAKNERGECFAEWLYMVFLAVMLSKIRGKTGPSQESEAAPIKLAADSTARNGGGVEGAVHGS